MYMLMMYAHMHIYISLSTTRVGAGLQTKFPTSAYASRSTAHVQANRRRIIVPAGIWVLKVSNRIQLQYLNFTNSKSDHASPPLSMLGGAHSPAVYSATMAAWKSDTSCTMVAVKWEAKASLSPSLPASRSSVRPGRIKLK